MQQIMHNLLFYLLTPSFKKFQQYYLRKRACPFWNEDNPFPFAISSQVMETLPSLRPKMTIMTSLEEADEAVAKIEKEMLAKIREKVPQLSQLLDKLSLNADSPTPNSTGATEALHTINEDMEEEDDQVQLRIVLNQRRPTLFLLTPHIPVIAQKLSKFLKVSKVFISISF